MEKRFKIIADFDERLARHPIGTILTNNDIITCYPRPIHMISIEYKSSILKRLEWYEERELPFYVKCITDSAMTNLGRHLVEKGRIIEVKSVNLNTFYSISPCSPSLYSKYYNNGKDSALTGCSYHYFTDYELSTKEEYDAQFARFKVGDIIIGIPSGCSDTYVLKVGPECTARAVDSRTLIPFQIGNQSDNLRLATDDEIEDYLIKRSGFKIGDRVWKMDGKGRNEGNIDYFKLIKKATTNITLSVDRFSKEESNLPFLAVYYDDYTSPLPEVTKVLGLVLQFGGHDITIDRVNKYICFTNGEIPFSWVERWYDYLGFKTDSIQAETIRYTAKCGTKVIGTRDEFEAIYNAIKDN